jgi:hypothetical protein
MDNKRITALLRRALESYSKVRTFDEIKMEFGKFTEHNCVG